MKAEKMVDRMAVQWVALSVARSAVEMVALKAGTRAGRWAGQLAN